MFKMLKLTIAVGLLGMTVAVSPGCGGDDEGGSSSDNTSSSSGTNCNQEYSCVNGACVCSAGPQMDQTCCDPNDSACITNKCDSFCRYCQ